MPTYGPEKKISFKTRKGEQVSFFGRERLKYEGTPADLRQSMLAQGFAEGFTNPAVAMLQKRYDSEKKLKSSKPPARKRAKRK
tara:strand:+ start:8338 stop:8586 length:249 start_codon:yes stop_codon:yes gene_type:complete